MQYIFSLLPLLLCPLLMGGMMWVMTRGMGSNQGQATSPSPRQAMPTLDSQRRGAEAPAQLLAGPGQPQDPQIAELQAQLERTLAQVEALERESPQLST